ncbi:nitroreductase family protein [Microbacterium sp. MPKO10]|uniref:nitroreductase family protein n=1 Tax=Microbacterium sp. MPKO10 TaxID=2989818 RepID=UPI0022360C62|nr:nitroreductase family protein [Microbacterium sp. MPKO10]MCW4459031.1 nitroreductase family protein [Microbacterium sp. MPKO10]
MTPQDRLAVTSAPISEVIAGRWSPRSFDVDVEVPEEKLTAALEAARWAASASNTQPWRFIVARRGTPQHERVVEHLLGFNQLWAVTAAVLIVNVAETVTEDGTERRWAEYDLGQASATLALQAHKDGLHVHQMGGFDPEGLRTEFSLDERFRVVSVTALGYLAAPDALPDEKLRAREVAPRERKALDEIVLVNA